MDKDNQRLFSLTYILLTCINLLTALGYSMIATIISPYAVTLGAGLTLAGTLSGIFSLSALVIRPFSGMALDILDKRNICLLSTLLMGVSFAGYAIAPNIAVMLFFRILHGMAFGINGTAILVLISEVLPEKRLGEGIGYFGLGQIVAQIIGPNAGIAIKGRLGYQSLFFLIAGLTLLSVGLLLLIKRRKPGTEKAFKEKRPFSRKNILAKECLVYALVGGLFSLGNGVTTSFLVLVGEERNISGIGIFFTVNAVVLLVMRLLMGRVIDRIGLGIIVNISLALTAVSMFFLGISQGLLLFLAAGVLKAAGQGGGQISLQSACIRKVEPARVGIATSTYFIGADIGQGLGPVLGGRISEAYSYRWMYLGTAVLMLLGILVFNLYEAKNRRLVSEAAGI
ncbi:MFS transporter [Anaerocolumna sp. AGMB13020]|uniref:MFS transporter n=1 Tax=Anaerocolumna sp. AGMB13020 TaxID=3081750 RepID=UPI002954C11C|nr:MFS transporter [Anaerocolumna sp. AGMB13020]WOO38310.1 MFS transporter [Anaerocolumna sp. AGMB13020]